MSYLKNFHYQILGPSGGKKLVFLHGLMGSGANWRAIAPSFEKDFQILLLDQRGHGRSFKPESGYSPEEYADDLAKILDELQWGKVYLVGHSMGGRNSLSFASKYPERLEKLVIEDITAEVDYESGERLKALINLVPVPFPSKKEAREFFSGGFEAKIPNHPKKKVLSQYFYTNIEVKEDGTGDWRFSKSAIFETIDRGRDISYWPVVEALSVQTLVVRGELSEDLTRSDLERYKRASPYIQIEELQGAGHWVHFEKREEFIALLKAFLL